MSSEAPGGGGAMRIGERGDSSPEARARAWVARWRTLPILDDEPLPNLLVRDGVDLTALIVDELGEVLAEAFATFDELEERQAAGALAVRVDDASGGPPTRPAGARIEVPADAAVRTRATVLWARSRGIEVVGPDGRPAMAASARPSWIRDWFRYRFLAPRALRTPVLDAWRASMALWEALGRSKEFRMSLISDDGIDMAPLVLPVLAHGVDEVFPEAVARRRR